MKNISDYFFIIAFIIAIPTKAIAVPSTARTICGEIRKIDIDKQQIDFYSYKSKEVFTLNKGRLSSFIKDNQKSDFDSLEEGIMGELIYKSPLFTDRYIVILRWVTNGVLESKACDGG